MTDIMAALVGLGAILAAATLVWMISVRLRDASIADVFWGLGFVLLAWLYCVLSPTMTPRSWLVTVLVTLWGARLSWHIFRRNHGHGEDPRYRAMRASRGPAFWWRSLFTVFWLQGAIVWFVALPLLVAMRATQPASLTAVDGLGIVVFAIGFGFEVVGDYQLARFRAEPSNRGTVLDRGLWRYTRHPNYFGDATLWWGLYVVAASTPGGWLTLLSPSLMTLLLMRVSGVTLLEDGLKASKPGYGDYMARTPAFFPWFPRDSGRMDPTPLSLDRATREREYSPSSVMGGNYAPFLERYRSESARALATLPAQRDLRYGDAPRALIDYFPPKPSASKPGLLVFIHGGYWQELSKDDSAFVAPAWHEAGFAHAVVGYTLAPEKRLPGIVAECRQALGWLRARADELGFDPTRIVVAGSSAGAYLAAACAAESTRAGPTGRAPAPVRGIVAVSGIYDVAPLVGTSINDALGLDESTAAALNLLDGSRTFCPAVVAWGENETAAFKAQSRSFAERLGEANTPCTTLEVEGRNHFDVILDLGDRETALFAEATRLLRS